MQISDFLSNVPLIGSRWGNKELKKHTISDSKYAGEYLLSLAATYDSSTQSGKQGELDRAMGANLRTIAGNEAFIKDFVKKNPLVITPLSIGGGAEVDLKPLAEAAKQCGTDKNDSGLTQAAKQLEKSFANRGPAWTVKAPAVNPAKTNDSNAQTALSWAPLLLAIPALLSGDITMLLLVAVGTFIYNAVGAPKMLAEAAGFGPSAKAEKYEGTGLPTHSRAPGQSYTAYATPPAGAVTLHKKEEQKIITRAGPKKDLNLLEIGTVHAASTALSTLTAAIGAADQYAVLVEYDANGMSKGIYLRGKNNALFALQGEKGVPQGFVVPKKIVKFDAEKKAAPAMENTATGFFNSSAAQTLNEQSANAALSYAYHAASSRATGTPSVYQLTPLDPNNTPPSQAQQVSDIARTVGLIAGAGNFSLASAWAIVPSIANPLKHNKTQEKIPKPEMEKLPKPTPEMEILPMPNLEVEKLPKPKLESTQTTQTPPPPPIANFPPKVEDAVRALPFITPVVRAVAPWPVGAAVSAANLFSPPKSASTEQEI